MQKTEALKKWWSGEKRIRILAILGAAGILLLCLSEFLPKEKAAAQKEESELQDFCQETEKKLEQILTQTQGAGRVRVMLTLESSDEKIYARDEKNDSKSDDGMQQRSVDEKFVLVGSGKENGVLLKTNAPKVKGVIVVCDGGDDPVVVKQMTTAVGSALGIGANRISVLKMKQTEAE